MALGRYAASLPALPEIELLPYHDMGRVKYENMGIPYPMEGIRVATREDVDRAEKIIEAAMQSTVG